MLNLDRQIYERMLGGSSSEPVLEVFSKSIAQENEPFLSGDIVDYRSFLPEVK